MTVVKTIKKKQDINVTTIKLKFMSSGSEITYIDKNEVKIIKSQERYK